MEFRQNVLLVTQTRKGMADVTSSGQVAEMVKCSRPSQTDVIFVAMDAFAEKVYVEDLIAERMRLPSRIPVCLI